MRIHAIETGKVAVKTRQRDGANGSGLMRLATTLMDNQWTEPLPILAWVIEHPEGLIVVDTGETSKTAQPGYFPRWHPYFKLGVREWVKPEEEIGPQLQALGMLDNVRRVVLTHMHTDHAGGLYHFPKAEFLVARKEYEAARGIGGRINGFLPQHWPHNFAPTLIDYVPEPVVSFPESYRLAEGVYLVPTNGHSPGHQSVIVQDGDLTYFIAGDTTYTEHHLKNRTIDGVTPDVAAARTTLERTLAYIQQRPTIYLPSHDPESVTRLQNQQVTTV